MSNEKNKCGFEQTKKNLLIIRQKVFGETKFGK